MAHVQSFLPDSYWQMKKAAKHPCLAQLIEAGISYDDAVALRRISMTLHRWHELECGTDYGCIERDEITGKAYWLNSTTMRRMPAIDRETGALKRLAAVMAQYPTLSAYVQTDPRGAALYILRHGDVPTITSRDLVIFKPSTNQSYNVPKGTDLIHVEGNNGGYAVKHSTAYGMSKWDSEHYFLYVPNDAVEHGDPSAYYSNGIAVYK